VPIYEYRCRKCSEEFELLVLASTAIECPACQSDHLDQLLSGFAVSSDGIRQSNAQAARRASLGSGQLKDQKIAHAEYVKKHSD